MESQSHPRAFDHIVVVFQKMLLRKIRAVKSVSKWQLLDKMSYPSHRMVCIDHDLDLDLDLDLDHNSS